MGTDEKLPERLRAEHVEEHDPSNGPPFCRTCSDEAQAWVQWPCPAVRLLDALGLEQVGWWDDPCSAGGGQHFSFDRYRSGSVPVYRLGSPAGRGVGRVGEIVARPRTTRREPLYLRAREAWSNRVEQPTRGGVIREADVYDSPSGEADHG